MDGLGSTLIIILAIVVLAIVQRARRRSQRDQRRASSRPEHRAPTASGAPEPTDINTTGRSQTGAREPFDAADFVTEVTPPEVVEGPAYVVDGDTVVVKKTQIRLYGIDAPEMNHPYGQKAKWALVRLCKGSKVRAEILDRDAHGRTVARCYLPDGRDLSAEMVKQGLAIDWPKFSNGAYALLEVPDARKKMWLADARQKGRMHAWEAFDARRSSKGVKDS